MTLSVSRGASAPMQSDKKADPPTVDGRWTGRITGTPHGDMAMGLSLKQEGTKVTGTLTTDHTGDLPVEGELQGRTLKLSTTGNAEPQLTLTGTLKDERTLGGTLFEPDGRHDLVGGTRQGQTVIRDLRHACRMIVRMPLLAAVVIVSLGVGIGANTIVFSWIQSVVLKPLPAVRDAGGFFFVEPRTDTGIYTEASWPEFRDLRDRLRAISGLMAFRHGAALYRRIRSRRARQWPARVEQLLFCAGSGACRRTVPSRGRDRHAE